MPPRISVKTHWDPGIFRAIGGEEILCSRVWGGKDGDDVHKVEEPHIKCHHTSLRAPTCAIWSGFSDCFLVKGEAGYGRLLSAWCQKSRNRYDGINKETNTFIYIYILCRSCVLHWWTLFIHGCCTRRTPEDSAHIWYLASIAPWCRTSCTSPRQLRFLGGISSWGGVLDLLAGLGKGGSKKSIASGCSETMANQDSECKSIWLDWDLIHCSITDLGWLTHPKMVKHIGAQIKPWRRNWVFGLVGSCSHWSRNDQHKDLGPTRKRNVV